MSEQSGPSFLPDEVAVANWVRDHYPHQCSLHWRITKHTEEAGEVAGAYVKMNDGSGRKTVADLRQECAQAYICLLGIAGAAGFRLSDAVAEEWERCNPEAALAVARASVDSRRAALFSEKAKNRG